MNEILALMNLDYDSALDTYSTQPYWARFTGSSDIVAPVHASNLNIARFAKGQHEIVAGMKRRTLPRVCSRCLAEDMATHGEPYFHRSHQLPLCRYCYQHGTSLFSLCRSCNRNFVGNSYPATPTLVCECGLDQRTVFLSSHNSDEPWVRLATFSHDVLHKPQCNFYPPSLRDYIKSRMGYDAKASLPTLLKEHYGNIGATWIVSFSNHTSAPISAVKDLRMGVVRPPQFCAILAALDVTLDKTLFRYAKHAPKPIRQSKDKHRPNRPSSVTQARSELRRYFDGIEIAKRGRGWLARSHRTLYCYLRIFDGEWFDRNVPGPHSNPEPIPDIASDRKTIRTRLAGLSALGNRKRHGFACVALDRARLRDAEWLRNAKIEAIAASRTQYARTLEKEFRDAYERAIRLTGRPKKIKVPLIARLIGLTTAQVSQRSRQFPQLQKYTTENQSSYYRRALAWAIEQCASTGRPLSVYVVCKLAKLHQVRDVTRICSALLAARA